MTAAGLLLAAGAGKRIGHPKALVEFDGQLLVERGVALLRSAGCRPVVVVVGARANEVHRHVHESATVVVAPDWAEGIAASLRVGLAEVAATPADQCIVALVDQPLLDARAVRSLIQAHGSAAVATYGGKSGHPVMLRRAIWSEVVSMAAGDAGARTWLRAHSALVTKVPCDGFGLPHDIDTVEDLTSAVLLLRNRDPGSNAAP